MSNLLLLIRDMEILVRAPARKPPREMLVNLPELEVSAVNSVA